MPALDLPIASDFWDHNHQWITALITFGTAVALSRLVDRMVTRRGRNLASAVAGGELSPVADTRLRLVRRLIGALIVFIGLLLALNQFSDIKRVATGVLASSAVLGIVVGFAARQTFANAIAGTLLAIAQPIRIGDLVTFEGETGTVEDVRLTYTYVRAGDGRRVIIPNERLAQSTIVNHTIFDPRVRVEVSLWVPADADVGAALDALSAEPGVEASVADMEKDGIRIAVVAWAPSAAERDSLAAGLRAKCIERLREASILGS
ncbi:MAG: mechanosensitive ion channel [Thermoleophilaceae bacterium]|nr:mechanosensitive ion channel [Thermoleophilaceae bacterium]